MDAYEFAKNLFFFLKKLAEKDYSIYFCSEYTDKLLKVLQALAPVLIVVCIYQYIKYNMINSSQQYENYVKRKRGYLRKISKKLKQLSKLNGQVYFYYLPVTHGTRLPPTYSLFMAFKEVLINSDIPAARGLRTNLLSDLIHSDVIGNTGSVKRMDLPETDFLDPAPNDADPFSDLNLDIMNYSREMIIHGIKDFDVMYTLYHIMETVSDDSDE